MTAVLNALLEITAYSAALFGAILLFQKLFHRQISAALNYAVWALLILRLLLPVTFDSGFHIFVIPDAPKQAVQADNANSTYTAPPKTASSPAVWQETGGASPKIAANNEPGYSDNGNDINPPAIWKTAWQAAPALLWGAGALGSLLYTAVLWKRLKKRLRLYGAAAPEYVLCLVEKCKKDMGIRADIEVSVQHWLKSPALSVSIKPKLLLPLHMLDTMDDRQLEFGIRHELTHFRRKDYITNLLLTVLRCVYWFNPFVHFAFRRMQTDMETACDASTTSRLGDTERISYIKTMIDLGGSGNMQYVLGMGMGRGRKAMEKRVRGIFMKKKTGTLTRMAVLMFAGILAVVCFTTACQPTPEKPAVVQKDTEKLIEKAKQPSAQVTEARSLKEQLKVPETLTAELASEKGKLKIHADAKIIVPDATALPTVRVGMRAFTDDDVKRLYDTLIGGAMPIDAENTPETRAQRMQTIDELLAQKKAGKLDKYETMEELDAAIKEVMKDASTLPEHFERAEPDFSFKELGDGAKEVRLRAAPDDATVSDLRVLNTPEGVGFSRVEYYRDLNCAASLSGLGGLSAFNETKSPYFKPPAISEEAARKLAADTVAALGLKDFVLSGHRLNALYNITADADDAPRIGVYEYMFTRNIGGVPLTYTNDEGNSTDGTKDKMPTYASAWLYEKVWIVIDDKGILYFEWDSPCDIKETVTDASAMMPFEDIRKIFEKNIPVIGNYYDTAERNWTCDMYVTEVRLGLMRIRENAGTNSLIVPVWDFMGYTKDSENFVNGKDGYEAMLTVNAIDGSIVQRSCGY